MARIHKLEVVELHNAETEWVVYQGQCALQVIEIDAENHGLVILTSSDFQNGVMETAIAGNRRPNTPDDMRGFVGIAFRVQSDASQFECFYVRPTNGRADDQLRRNHATQYISHPDHPWYRLRQEHPGVY